MENIAVQEITQKYLLGERDFRNSNLSKANLSKKNFSEINFKHTDFSYANLQGVNFSKANLSRCNFKGANLKGANLKGANFDDSDFSYSNLIEANLADSRGKNTNFEKAHLNNINFANCYLVCANLTQVSLNNGNLTKVNLSQAKLTGSFLTKANLTNAYLGKADITRTFLTGAIINKTYLRYAVYDTQTQFDVHINPQDLGMTLQANKLENSLTIDDLLEGINYISQCSYKYLGSTLARKYLVSCKPDNSWLNNFKINEQGLLFFEGLNTSESINDFQFQWYQQWVESYISSCSMIVSNFSELIDFSKLPVELTKLKSVA